MLVPTSLASNSRRFALTIEEHAERYAAIVLRDVRSRGAVSNLTCTWDGCDAGIASVGSLR